jgi:hypothetical protein
MNMLKRHERRKTTAKQGKELKAATLDQHFEETLRRVRTEFEHTGEIHPTIECLTNRESFDVPVSWSDSSERAAACIALKDCFRRRGVNRYVFTSEAWMSKTPGLRPADDPDRSESVQVLAVERNGLRRYASAEITRNGQTATLGPWQVSSDAPESWLAELLEEGYSDRSPEPEPPPVGEISKSDFQDLRYRHPEQAAEFEDSFEVHSELSELVDYELKKHADGGPVAMFMALESILRGIVKDMGSPTGISQFARFLRDHPDAFSMFSAVPDQVPSTQQVRRYRAALECFDCEKRSAGHTPSAIFGAFMNMYMDLGSQAIGALDLADRIENWDPEHQAKLRQAGLRSSFELDDDEGRVFIALSAERHPIGIMGRRNTNGDLFVSGLVDFPEPDFDTAVEKIKEAGVDMILGSDAEELLCKMEHVTGTVLRTDKKEIWEVEEWGKDEWLEQAAAEVAFAMAMNVQHDVEGNSLNGNVAGYQVRRAQNGLVLVSADGGEDIFVGVKVERNKQRAQVLGWLRGSEGKIPSFYQKNCWVIPAEALHDIEELPGRERLRATPPYEEMSS